jgi:hypothetical protein
LSERERRWRSLATCHRESEEREDKIQTGFLSDIYSILYIVSYLCGKSPCLTTTPDWKILGAGFGWYRKFWVRYRKVGGGFRRCIEFLAWGWKISDSVSF